jgi:hypothetical protein
MDLRTPFNALHHFWANGGDLALQPTAPLVLPPNAPAQLVQQVWTQAANNSLQAMAQPGIQVDYTIVNAVIESPRLAAEHRTDGALSATRVGGGDVQLSAIEKSAKWQRIAI